MSRDFSGSSRVLAFIKMEVEAGRGFPDNDAIAEHMKWKSSSGVKYTLIKLEFDGKIRFVKRVPSARGWRYVYAYDGEKAIT